MNKKGTLKIYGVGGTGLNIVSHFLNAPDLPDFAKIEVAFMDTSHANVTAKLSDSQYFIVPGVDGAGKIRGDVAGPVTKALPAALEKLPPGDFNVVVYSAAGGSGSTAGILLHAELLARELPVISIVIGSYESQITAKNTVNTQKSIDHIARTRQLPFSMKWIVVDPLEGGYTKSQADSEAQRFCGLLGVVASRQHHGVDTADLGNFVNYTKVTQVAPQLTLIDDYSSDDELKKVEYPIAILSLTKDHDYTLPIAAGYVCDGILTAETKGVPDRLQFVISAGEVPHVYKHAEERYLKIEKSLAARPKSEALAKADEASDDSGLIL